MYFVVDAREAIDRSADSSRTTHGAQEAVDACRYFAGLLVGALKGIDKEKLLSARYSPVAGLWESAMLSPKIAEIAGRLVQDQAAARHQGKRVRCGHPGGGALGLPPHR